MPCAGATLRYVEKSDIKRRAQQSEERYKEKSAKREERYKEKNALKRRALRAREA